MHWVTVPEALAIHQAAIEHHGGAAGLRDQGLLESALLSPRQTFEGAPLHPTLWQQAAALGRSLATNHPFVDGNKRVAFALMVLVLRRNGFDLIANADACTSTIWQLAAGTLRREELADWLERNSRPIH